jgi:hypothetical protein
MHSDRIQTADRTCRTVYSGFGLGLASWLNQTSGSGSGSAKKVENQTELNFGSTICVYPRVLPRVLPRVWVQVQIFVPTKNPYP